MHLATYAHSTRSSANSPPEALNQDATVDGRSRDTTPNAETTEENSTKGSLEVHPIQLKTPKDSTNNRKHDNSGRFLDETPTPRIPRKKEQNQ